MGDDLNQRVRIRRHGVGYAAHGHHFYAWDEPSVFFSVDIYTCKAFDAHDAVEFTRAFLGADEVVAKEF